MPNGAALALQVPLQQKTAVRDACDYFHHVTGNSYSGSMLAHAWSRSPHAKERVAETFQQALTQLQNTGSPAQGHLSMGAVPTDPAQVQQDVLREDAVNMTIGMRQMGMRRGRLMRQREQIATARPYQDMQSASRLFCAVVNFRANPDDVLQKFDQANARLGDEMRAADIAHLWSHPSMRNLGLDDILTQAADYQLRLPGIDLSDAMRLTTIEAKSGMHRAKLTTQFQRFLDQGVPIDDALTMVQPIAELAAGGEVRRTVGHALQLYRDPFAGAVLDHKLMARYTAILLHHMLEAQRIAEAQAAAVNLGNASFGAGGQAPMPALVPPEMAGNALFQGP